MNTEKLPEFIRFKAKVIDRKGRIIDEPDNTMQEVLIPSKYVIGITRSHKTGIKVIVDETILRIMNIKIESLTDNLDYLFDHG